MTSTNDGKDVKSYQTSGPKGKSHYIELYKSLEARLSEVTEASVRAHHLCDAWRQVHTLCLHSALSTHPHLLSWLQKHTARTILQTKWQSAERKDDRATLEAAIDAFIAQCQQAASERESFPWETQLIARGEWFKKVLDRPWDHPVLSVLLNPSGTPPTDDEVLSWLVSERGVTFTMRLQTLVAEKCEDIAASLAAAVMDRVRARAILVPDLLQTDDKDKSNLSPALSDFAEKLSSDAGFTTEVWELLTDIEFVLLHKRDSSRCIALAKQTPLKSAYQLVERLQSRLELAPREKRLWKNAKDVAVLIAQVVITRCMVIPVCAGLGRNALYCCSRSLARALGPKFAPAAAALAAPAASARHLHTLATAVDAHFTQNNDQKMKPFVCELYVRAITAGMNELERLKIKTEKESEARQMEQTLASWFVQLGAVLSSSDRIRCECTLTAFSVHPSMNMYERIKAAPMLPKSAVELESPSKEEPTSEFGSWASDSRSQTNFVKTSETLNMKQMQNQANVLSTAILNEGEALGLSPDLCHDIAVLLSGPRVKTLSWDMDREQLIEKCRVYMERTHGGTRTLTTELKYLNLDPNEFMHLPEEDDDENDLYYGIEKGYEHLVQFQDPEDIWKDPENTESVHSTYSSSEVEVVPSRRKKKGKKVALSSDDDADPLSIVAENQRNEKKERPHSKERSKERKKKESISRDPLEINPPKEKKEKPPKKEKEKKERKKKVKSSRESLAKLIGIKMFKQPSNPKKAPNTIVPTSSFTDSDCDSQGKLSFSSLNSEQTDVLYDGFFSMDELKSPEPARKHSDNYLINRFQNDEPVLDPHKKPVNYLSHSPSMVTDEVKKSLCRLIDNRRQKVMDQGNQNPEPNMYIDKSIVDFRSYKTMVSKNIQTQTSQRKVQNAIRRPKTPLQTCISPKAVAIPEIPTSIINKDSQRLVQIKKGVEDYLQRYQSNLNEISIPSPVIQYAKKNDETPYLQYSNPFKMSDLVTVPQERYGPYDTKPVFTQSRPGGPVHRPPIRETPGQLSYQKFLEEFQRSEYENFNKSLKKDIKPVSRVPPVIPNVNKAEIKTPQRAKPIPQQKKQDNSLNTFSRLSYMHKNKQTDIKNKMIELPDHGNVKTVSMESKIDNFVLDHLRKSSQNQSYPVNPPKISKEYQNTRKPETSGEPKYPTLSNMLGHSQIGNANLIKTPTIKNVKPILKRNASLPNSYLSEKDQHDLIILLRQQNKLTAPAPFSRPMNLKTYATCPPLSSIISETIVNNHSTPSTSGTSITNTLKKPVNENKQINIISTSIIKPANSASDVPNTIKPTNIAKKNIKVDVQEKPKKPESFKPKVPGKTELKKSEDWQAVMNAIRAQRTPIRGPNALDVALNKSSFEKAFEDSLRNNAFTEPDSEMDVNKVKTDKPQPNKHSVGSHDTVATDGSKSTKTHDRPKVSHKPAGSIKDVSAMKSMNTKNMMQKNTNNIDRSQKMPVEHSKKKLPYAGHKRDDPFISGIPNSDYDLIEELMDDDLRKEIGELSSDEEYSAAAANILKPTKPNEKRVSVIYNKTLDTIPALQKSVVANQTNRVQPQKCIYANKAGKAVQGPPKPVNYHYNATSKPCMKVTTPNVPAPSASAPTHVFSNTKTYVSNSIAVDSNMYISAVPQPPVQNVVLIGSNVYESYPNVQSPVAVTNMNPNAYVTVNNVPNMTLYQSTQFTATVINSVTIENAITMPVASNMPCTLPVQTNAVNNSISPEYNTNKEIPSVQEYSKPTVASCEVSKTESKPYYNSNDRPLVNEHVKTDVDVHDTNPNRNSERKVLSEVQEKQVFSQVQEKQVSPEVGDHKDKPKKIDYNKIIDQERLRKKRIALMNRKICHYSERKPIALGYSPICPVIQNTLSEPEIYCRSETNIEDQKPEAGLEVASPASQDSIDNCKENKDNALTCRRILLRSSNKIKSKVPNDMSTKTVNIKTTIDAPKIAKEAKTNIAKIVKDGPKKKRVSKRLRNKSIMKEKTQKQNPRRLKLNVGKKVPVKMKSKEVINKIETVDNIDCATNYLDIEDELVGSKIPKICKNVKTIKSESVSKDNAKEDKELAQSLSQNDDNIDKSLSGIDHDTKVATRRSSRLAGNANNQPTKDLSEAEKLTSMSAEIEVYVPILSDSENSAGDPKLPSNNMSNLPDVSIERDGTSIVTAQNETLLLEQLSKLNQNQTEPEINNCATDINTLHLDKTKNEVSEEAKCKNISTVSIQDIAEPVTKSAEWSIYNEAQICTDPVLKSVAIETNDGLKQKVKEIKTCHDSVVTSKDKSVNVECDMTETIKASSDKLPAAKDVEIENEKDTTLANQNDVQLNDTTPIRSKTPEIGNINDTVEDDVIVCSDVIKSSNNCKSKDNKTERNVNISDIPQSFKDSIKIDHFPNQDFDDPLKKCVRIKLPNGRVFKATIYGQVNVSFDSLFEEPSIKSVLLNSLTSNKKRYTLNVQQTTTVSKHDLKVMSTDIKQIPPKNRGQIIDTVNLLSDDEEEFFQEFTTEFGKYKIQPIDPQAYKMYQNQLKLKSTVLLERCDHKKGKSLPTNTIDLTSKNVGSKDDRIQLDKLESPTLTTTFEKCQETVSSNSKIDKEIIDVDDNKGNEVNNKKNEADDVVLIDDSSSEDEVTIRNKEPEVINVLANKLLMDLGVGVTPGVLKIDDPLLLKDMILHDLGVDIQPNVVNETNPTLKPTADTDKIVLSSMPIEIPEIDLTEESSVSEPALKSIQGENIAKCFVKLVRCDDLVDLFVKTRNKESTENITDINVEKAIDIVKENIVDVDVANTEMSIGASNDSAISIITNLDEASPKPRSRYNSFSILDDFPILNDIGMQCTDHDRSSSQMMPLTCDSDWFITKRIRNSYFNACKGLQNVSPVIPLCCNSEWFTTKDIISKQSMLNSFDLEPITVLSNFYIEEMSIEVPTLTSLTLANLQSTDLINHLQPISSAHNLISGTLKRKLVSSNEVSTPKITKFNASDETNAQINSSDSDLTDMSDVTICDEYSSKIFDDTSVLLESAECITTKVKEIISDSVDTVVDNISSGHNIMKNFKNTTDVTSSMVLNQVEDQVILDYAVSVGITNDKSVVCVKTSTSNDFVCDNMQIDSNTEQSDIITVCENYVARTVEHCELSAIAADSKNEDCTDTTCEEITLSNRVTCENMDNIMEHSSIVEIDYNADQFAVIRECGNDIARTVKGSDLLAKSGDSEKGNYCDKITYLTCEETTQSNKVTCENMDSIIMKDPNIVGVDCNAEQSDIINECANDIARAVGDSDLSAISNDSGNENCTDTITNLTYEETTQSNNVTCENVDSIAMEHPNIVKNYCNTEQSDIIDDYTNDIARTIENSELSQSDTISNLKCEETTQSNNLMCENMNCNIIEQPDIIKKCARSNKLTQDDKKITDISGDSENLVNSNLNEQLDNAETCESKGVQENTNISVISGNLENHITNVVDDVITTPEMVVCENVYDNTTVNDIVEMYAPKIAQDDIYVAAVSNDSIIENEVKDITDVICEEIIKSNCVIVNDSIAKERKTIKMHENESTSKSDLEGDIKISVISDDTKSKDHSLADCFVSSKTTEEQKLVTIMKIVNNNSENVMNNIQNVDESPINVVDINTVLDCSTCGANIDLSVSEEFKIGSKIINEPIAVCDTELGAEETVKNLSNVNDIHEDFLDDNSDVVKQKSILNRSEDISTVSNYLKDDTNKTNKYQAQADLSPTSGESALNWEMSVVNADENTTESLPTLPNNTEAILTKYLKLTGEEGSEIILKGIEYVDPEAGTCYMFPLVEQSSSPEVVLEVADRDETINIIREVTNESTNDKIGEVLDCDTDLEVILPTNTYSKVDEGFTVTRNLKRKRDMSEVRLQEKKYRKGKNIDYPKITVAAMNETVYVKEYKRLIDYYSTLKFSYSRPFHKENIDIEDMMPNWPLRDVHTNTNAEPVDVEATIFTEGVDNAISPKDPLEQTLAQELNSDYNETEYKPTDIIETNFSMGFGEGSGRVIQHSKTVKISKLSAATLSDVKPHQPFLSSEKNSKKIDYTLVEKNDEKKILNQNMNIIKLKEKVRSFFKKTATELTHDFEKEHKKFSDEDTLNFPFGLTSNDFFGQLAHEVVVNVVQVGQLPVSAAAQNPVTCDPRVTHVSNVSPSQCSAENSPGDENQTSIKTEYTELTTADITLPLVQEYAQHHQFTSNDTQESSKSHEADHNVCISTEINSEIKIELTEETSQDKMEDNDSYENEPLLIQSGNNVNNGVEYIYNEVPNNSSVESHPNRHTMPDEAKMSNTFCESKDEEKLNKTDQLAHAMNAAGITPSSNAINTTNADALVDIISQNAQSDVVTTTQMNTNNYSKSTPINAMALQQALAQILPPPLSQTSTSESGQTPTNAVAQPVLHIVQGSNSQTVLNTQNGTPLLHIVQNKSATTSNGTPASQANSFGGLSLVDTGLQQGGNQLLHIVNTGNQKNNNAGQLLKRVNLLTNIANVGSNEQKMVQFVCKSADGKSIQLNAPHQRSMVLRLQPIDPSTIQTNPKSAEPQDMSANSGNPLNNKDMSQQEIKSRSVYEENYAKFIQNGNGKPGQEKATSLPKFNQVFGKQVSYKENKNEINNDVLSENTESKQNDNLHIDQINEINNPPLLLRKSTAQTSQASNNLVQQIKQTIAPMNIQTMHGGVIYTRQIPVNIGGGQTINLITVPSTELVDDTNQKQQSENKFTNQDGDHVIKIVQNQSNNSNTQNEDNNNAHINSGNDTSQAPQPQPVLTQMRIKLPMLSKTPQMVSAARVVRPSFFQIQRNVIGGANQPVYQQLVLTTAPSLGQSIRVPAQAQPARPAKPPESQSSPESQMSSSTLEQLREFDMVLEQVKERSTVQPSSSNSNSFSSIHSSADTTDSSAVVSTSVTETTQQVLYTTGNQTLNIASYVNRKSTVTSASTSFVRSPDSSGIVESPSSSTHNHIPHTATSESTSSETSTQPKPKKKKSKPSSSTTSALKLNTTPPKTSTQKPLEDEQTTQRILYILAEYKEQVENSPDKDKPAPRRRNNLPTNASGSSKRKKSSSGSRRRDMSPIHGEDSCRTMGSEDSSCGTSLGECAECMESHSPQESPRKVVRRLTFEQETTTTTQVTTQTRTIPQRNVIVADGQTITVARGTTGKPATTVLMPANYLLPVSMVKGGQQIAIVTNRGPKLLVGGGEGGTGGTLLFQRLIGPAGLKPVLTRPGVRHIRLPTAALHNLQAFNLAGAAGPVDNTASPAPAPVPAPPDLVDSRAMSSPWPDRDAGEMKPERGSSPEGSEPWNLPSSSIADDYGYEEVVRTDNMDRTVLDAIPDRYSPDMEAQRIFDKMFDVDSKKSMYDSSRCGYDIDASDTDDRPYQVVQRKDGRHHRLTHVSAAALRHKYAILEHELRLQKSLSEECEDLGVDSPSASELFPEAELLFAPSPVHEQTIGPCHTPQPTILNQGIPQPDLDDQIASDHLLTPRGRQSDLDIQLDDVGEIVTVGEDGMATIPLDHEEFARSHPNTTFHTEPEDGEIPPFTIAQSIKGRQITFHASRGPSTVVMAPQTTVISQATVEATGTQNTVKFTDIDNIINSIPSTQPQMPSVLVKDDGLTRFDNILTDSRELHLSNTASAIVHSTGQGTQVIRRVRYDENRRESRYLIDEPDPMEEKVDDNRDLESMAGDDNSSPERHPELFWESNSASERSEGRRRLDFSSDSDKCCKSPFDDSTDSSFGNHVRLDSVIKAARTERSGSDGSSDDHPPLRTYPAKRTHHHPTHHDAEQSLSGKTRAGERCMDVEGRRRASNRGVVKRGCHCCNGSPAPPKPKKSRQKKTPADFTNSNNN